MENDKADLLKIKRDKSRLASTESARPEKTPEKAPAIATGEIITNSATLEHRATRDYHELSAQVARLSGEVKILKNRLNTLVDFYEMKVDSIYRTISDVLPAMIRNGNLVVPTSRENDESRATSAFVKLDVETWAKEVAATTSGFLEQGIYRAPFIFAGFKFHSEVIVHPEYVDIPGTIKGIVMYGPYKKLLPGNYIVECYVSDTGKLNSSDSAVDLEIDIFDASKKTIVNSSTVVRSFVESKALMVSAAFRCNPDQSDSLFEIRLHQKGKSPFRLNKLHVIYNGN